MSICISREIKIFVYLRIVFGRDNVQHSIFEIINVYISTIKKHFIARNNND